MLCFLRLQLSIDQPHKWPAYTDDSSRHTRMITSEKMNERTPLLTTLGIAPPRQRYSPNVVRRVCTILLCGSLAILTALFLLPSTLFPHDRHRYPHIHPPATETLSYEVLQNILLTTPNEEQAQEWSKYYTDGAHLAGKNFSQALWTQAKWKEFGIEDTTIVAYDTYINYPLGHRLALYEKKGAESILDESKWEVKFEAILEEDVIDEDETTSRADRIPTFHGYSANGNVTAAYVYVNYGTYQDFEDLVQANVSLKGKIAVARYGGIFRGLKIKRAQELGMLGAVLFDDPGSDGEFTEENGYEAYPNGPARQPSSVQRGSAQFLSVAPGDPTTPSYPSKPGVPREPVEGRIPSIPSLPISYMEALPILKSLNGHGPKASDFNKFWTENIGLEYKGVKYNVGPSPENLQLNLVNEQEYVTTPLWNVIGVINGTFEDEVVVLGNHRDAWIVGGAGDPNSGSAALNEVIRAFGQALQLGWKPLRTIVFASWDGEEYGLIGSTEWVEEYLPWLSKANVAYVNVDIGARGTEFKTAASPLLNNIIYEITALVPSPNQTIPGQTVRDLWSGKISTMGSGSDFTAFQDFAGIPSVDMGFGSDGSDPVYHYHSNYDSYHWMNRFCDPGFKYHAAIARILGLFVAKLSESPVIPLNATDYAIALKAYIAKAQSKLSDTRTLSSAEFEEEEREARYRPASVTTKGSKKALDDAFKKLEKAADKFRKVAIQHDEYAAELAEAAGSDIPWWKWFTKAKLYWNIRKVNDKYKYLERQFLYQEGLDGRSWFKHVVFAPGLWTGYAGGTFSAS